MGASVQLVSWLYMSCEDLLPVPAVMTPPHDELYSQTESQKQTKKNPFLKWLSSDNLSQQGGQELRAQLS